ncbi:hypothetical protein BC830DRAFT_1171190 [Chytriomyces sp. MP71]|nr:hypothetical protein BC830DRAFT_1171190 [Chytriomyces sp. MP71]
METELVPAELDVTDVLEDVSLDASSPMGTAGYAVTNLAEGPAPEVPDAPYASSPNLKPSANLGLDPNAVSVPSVTVGMSTDHGVRTPIRDKAPVTLALRPVTRRRIVISYERVVDEKLPLVVPRILRFVKDEQTLRECLRVNWCFMGASAARLYQNVALFGAQGHVLKRLLKLLTKAADEETLLDYRRIVRSLDAGDLMLEEQEVTKYQSWNLIREVIRRVAPNLERLYLDSSDPRFHDPDQIHPHTCGLDQRVQFSRLRNITIGPGCLAFPDAFLVDLLRRCPRDSIASVRLPGCARDWPREGFELIAARGGKALQDLILTPPGSYPAPVEETIPAAEGGLVQLEDGMRNGIAVRRGPFKGQYDAKQAWDFETFCSGLELVIDSCPDLRALDISGHTQGLKPGLIDKLITKCPLLEELDMPCGINDSVMYELLLAKPKHLWRINASCHCHKSYQDLFITPAEAAAHSLVSSFSSNSTSSANNASSAPLIKLASNANAPGLVPRPPCSVLTDAVVKAVIDEILPGKVGALLELPTHGMQVRSAKWVPMLAVLEEIGGAKVDFRDTNGVYIPRIGVKVVVPNGRLFLS